MPAANTLTAVAFIFLAPAWLAAQPTSQTFDAQGVKLHYVVEGRGPAVVLIHGLNASAQINWQMPGVFAELARDHQVVALDLPGHGQSDKPTDAKAYGSQMVDDVALLLDHLKLERAHIVGYSLGGMIALEFTAKYPDRVISTTLGGMGWMRDGGALQRFWERIPTRDGARTPSVCMQSMGQLALSEQELQSIKSPVRVIVGDRDPVQRLYVSPLQQARSDWTVVEVAGAGHMNCIMKPEFKTEVAAWVRKNDPVK